METGEFATMHLNDLLHKLQQELDQPQPSLPRARELAADAVHLLNSTTAVAGTPFFEALAHTVRQHSLTSGLPLRLQLPNGDLPAFPPEAGAQILEILTHAISNACRHSHAHQAELALQLVDGKARFVLFDDGIGFDPDLQKGASLHIMAERAKALGADLGIFSRPGFGSNIVLSVPLQFTINQASPDPGAGITLASQRILIADPSLLLLDSLHNLLRLRGHNVVGIVTSAKDLPKAVQRLAPTLVLADGAMLADPVWLMGLAGLRLVVMAEVESEQGLRASLRIGAVGYLGKSQSANELLSSLEKICQGQLQLSPVVANKALAGFLTRTLPQQDLSQIQRQILEFLHTNITYDEIAKRLNVSEPTIKYNVKQICQKLHFKNRAELRKSLQNQ